MTEIDINAATNTQLNYLLAEAMGLEVGITPGPYVVIRQDNVTSYFDVTTNWGWAGPILNQMVAEQGCTVGVDVNGRTFVRSPGGITGSSEYSSVPEALARCAIKMKLGESAKIPDELIESSSRPSQTPRG